ncbi:MAG: LL-diaminopimelate aminotransferase [Candidatus Syntrophoarchaeum sp.]|nr:LL-diaminopimelate aminotransferase [Candidatus Syntrophoarchaeum sp.]
MIYADRINQLPPYLFARIDEMKEEAKKSGIDLIDLSIGDPDIPTPQTIIEELYDAVKDPKTHRYPTYDGMLSFREAVAGWYKRIKDVKLDPVNEVVALIGSKEGIAHIPFGFVNPGDYVLVPDPAYPVYLNSTILAGGKPHVMPLLRENDFLPDLSRIETEILKKTKLLFLNYPNNPTSAVAKREFFEEVVDFAKEHDIIVCHDNPYSEIVFDDTRAPSFLEIDGAREVGIEFNSLSKTCNMTGWRIGYAVGSSKVLEGLLKVKTNIDSGAFEAIQRAGIKALEIADKVASENSRIYSKRRDVLCRGLEIDPPSATFYLWAPVPDGYDSFSFTEALLSKCGILVTPGIGFGKYGEGFVRFALTESVQRIEEAVERVKKEFIFKQ